MINECSSLKKWSIIIGSTNSSPVHQLGDGRSEVPEDTPAPRGGGAEEQIINSSEADSEAGKTQLQVGKT